MAIELPVVWTDAHRLHEPGAEAKRSRSGTRGRAAACGPTGQVESSRNPPAAVHAVGPSLISLFNLYPSATIIGLPAEGFSSGEVLKLMEELEDHDDVQGVAANFDISEEEMAQFSAAG